MLQRLAFASLAAPMILFVALLVIPGFDRPWGTFSFHFYIVSATSLLAASACLILMLSARSLRETRILFLALSFFALGMIFAIHGLQTPGIIFDEPFAALERSPWLATLAAGVFATLSVVSVRGLSERVNIRNPEMVFVGAASVITLYFVISMAAPDWLAGFPTTNKWFQHLLTATTVGLLVFAGIRYYQSYLFARLPAQLSVAVGLFFLAEAQISLDFGTFWS
ncbi:MAG: hypothetical protein IIA90_08215, partial [Chloroflexi bacterium]|nr:hypothetical protein [Chloroflexota bacterium]